MKRWFDIVKENEKIRGVMVTSTHFFFNDLGEINEHYDTRVCDKNKLKPDDDWLLKKYDSDEVGLLFNRKYKSRRYTLQERASREIKVYQNPKDRFYIIEVLGADIYGRQYYVIKPSY